MTKDLFETIMNTKHPLPHQFHKKSEETKVKISNTLSSVPKTDKHKENISKGMMGNSNPSKPVVHNGVTYRSMKECSRLTKLSYSTLKKMMISSNFPNVHEPKPI